jgi:hypothetical protein
MAPKQPPQPGGNGPAKGPLPGQNPKGAPAKAGAAGTATKIPEAIPEPDLPPEPTVFQKYSQHHEFPLSTMASIVSHALVLLMAALAAGLIIQWGDNREPPEIDSIVFAGGGGSGEGGGDLSGDEDLKEVITFDPERLQSDTPTVTFNREDIADSVTQSTKERVIEQARSAEKQARGTDATKRAGHIGRGGPGSGGGLGSGHGTGEGSGSGPGKMTKRAMRIDRWSIIIKFASGEEYRSKLANLNAMVAIPEGKGQFKLFRDLDKKTSTIDTPAGLTKLNMTYWQNADPEAVSGLAQALGATTSPSYLYVFFPIELEKELLKAELAHAKMNEDQINERGILTKFSAVREGNKYVVKVLEQGKKKK